MKNFFNIKIKNIKNTKGFTLIELLVVVAIIGILSSVVLASLNSAREKARDTRRKSDLKQIQNALELYYSNCGTYIVAPGCTGTPYYGYSDVNGSGGYFNSAYGWKSISQGLVDEGVVGNIIVDPSGSTNNGQAYMIWLNKDHYTIWATISYPTQLDITTINKCYFSGYDNYNGAPNHNYCLSN